LQATNLLPVVLGWLSSEISEPPRPCCCQSTSRSLISHRPAAMPDSFFQSDKKRKRPSRPGSTPGSGPSKQPYEKPYRPAAYGKGQKPKGRSSRQSARDEDLSSDEDGEGGGVDLDDMDFRRGRNDDAMSDGELIDENETAAEKRVRLAKGYLAKVREEVAAGE
jgi:ribosomal RNA-processing protein 9